MNSNVMSEIYDLKVLNDLLTAHTDDLLHNCKEYFGDKAEYDHSGRYVFIDNGAKVLAVAHLDTVGGSSWKNNGTKQKPLWEKVKYGIPEPLYYGSKADVEITSIQLDDRLGVWLITNVLSKLDMQYDILLTTDEEIGASTARNFDTKKQYNWIFEFDRRGYGNVVMYQYHTKELETILESAGYDVQHGTFSDISMLDSLGCSAFNFGCGYNLEHTDKCYTTLSKVHLCVAMFEGFYNGYKDTHFEHEGYDDFGYYDVFGCGYHNRFSQPAGKSVCKICGTDYKVFSGYCDQCFQDEGVWHRVSEKVSFCNVCGLEFSEDDLLNGMCIDCMEEVDWEAVPWEHKVECYYCGGMFERDEVIEETHQGGESDYCCMNCNETAGGLLTNK